ncbi:hypothetical protein V3481_006510 [Fusarium oxysporum f. sp. vasinfectum]
MRGSARRRHRTPARYSFQPVIAAKSLSRASCSQIKAQQEVLYSRVRQGPDGRKQRRANDAELENSGARAGIRVRVETAGLRTLSVYRPAMSLRACTPSRTYKASSNG